MISFPLGFDRLLFVCPACGHYWIGSCARHLLLATFCMAAHPSAGRTQEPAVADDAAIRLTVHPEVLHDIDVRLFGQFLERASWGEPGPEAYADPETGELPERIVDMLKAMEIPVIRFPGGTDVDYLDWRDMIDNAPGRASAARPVSESRRPGRERVDTISNRFGYDEYFELRNELGCETILVVNLLDGLAKRRPLEEAARNAAGLVAYANAPAGVDLPENMPDWPAVRAKNGHPEPFKAEYVQIGNEMFLRQAKDQAMAAAGVENLRDAAPWYLEVFTAYVKAIRTVDPDIEIIIDGWLGRGTSEVVQNDPYIRGNVSYLAMHNYAPGPADQIKKNGEGMDDPGLSDAELWRAWATMPGHYDSGGQCIGFGDNVTNPLAARNYAIAATEWNWNGWAWAGMTESFDAPAAAGLGVAGFIQGLMRQGDQIRLATQSMLVGGGWDIAAIQGDPDGEFEPYYNAQSSATTFYRHRHGSRLLRSELTGVHTNPQPYSFGWGGGNLDAVAEVDVLVTAGDRTVFVHAINRTFDQPRKIEIDLSRLGSIFGAAIHHTLSFDMKHSGDQSIAHTDSSVLPAADTLTVILPARTVSIFEFQRTGK